MVPQVVQVYLVTAFFELCTIAAVIFLHVLGNRLFVLAIESGRRTSIAFGATSLVLGLAGLLISTLLLEAEAALALGLVSGLAIWTALGEVAEHLGWVSPLSRSAILLYVPSLAAWCASLLLRFPVGLVAAAGYPVSVWGLHLLRVRVLARYGPNSLAATIVALFNSAVAGGGLALGLVKGSMLSGIVGGIVFAMAIWSTLEIIWERGMAKRPWRTGYRGGE
ncbi:hypothetical protein JW921_03120 [Candidatus Fermentibacterales bacterium]|nr:hypothetical protein [Candidatus Fermentibacterales bacterium]